VRWRPRTSSYAASLMRLESSSIKTTHR
jgi:hypothetical protein